MLAPRCPHALGVRVDWKVVGGLWAWLLLSLGLAWQPPTTSTSAVTTEQQPAAQKIVLLSFNIHHAEGSDERLDLARIAAVIRESQADIVALQEVDQGVARSKSIDQPQQLAQMLGMQFAFGGNIDLQGGQYGNAVLSRFPIVRTANHRLPNLNGGEQRGVMEVVLQLPQARQLTLLATHLDHRSDPAERLASARFINQLVAADAGRLWCLAGDLNAVPESSVLLECQQRWSLPATQHQPTIPVSRPTRKIDYILVPRQTQPGQLRLREVESQVIANEVASDHLPLRSVLEIDHAPRPNVLFIAVDDLNDWIGCLQGHPQTLTPHIDALAARGVLFTNAHCASPACNPSRAAIFSGRAPQHTGVWSNDSPQLLRQHPDILAIPRAFEQAGYTTLGTGKLLHGGGKDNRELFQHWFNPEQRWSPFTSAAVAYTPQELPSKGSSHPRHMARLPSGESIELPLNGLPSDRQPNSVGGESFDWGPLPIDDAQMGDTQITDWAIDRLRTLERTTPFFMGVGYYRPHIPLFAPAKYFEPFPLEAIQLPPHSLDDLTDLSPTGRRWALEAVTAGSHATVVQGQQWSAAVRAYLACVHYVDHELGRLIAALDASPQADNTWIFLWTDHGWHLGEKQHWGKWTGWERSTRVPLMVVPPLKQAQHFAAAGARCPSPVSLLDLYPTLVEVCRLTGPEILDGQSLVDLLRDPALETGRAVVTSFDQGNLTVRDARYRYIRYADGNEELYDHRDDPHEWHNLVEQLAYTSQLMRLREVAEK